jgi:hypothetical protein
MTGPAGTFPTTGSKKGLQVEDVADALALGVRHASINLNLCRLVSPHAAGNVAALECEAGRFTFDLDYAAELDAQIKPLSDHGVLVYLVVLAYVSGDATINRLMLHPGYSPAAPNFLGAFNTVSPEGRAWLAAAMEFLAQRWSGPDQAHGRVVGYVIGNEVTVHWWWHHMGRVAMEPFADEYLRAVRLAHQAVRTRAAWPRVYISLDHHWNLRYPQADPLQGFAGRAFVDYFARGAREGGDFDWHLAFHSYPESLYEPRFWNDVTATPDDDTLRVTFGNLEVLVRHFSRGELLFDGRRRSIIISEQGFNTPDGPDGELIQAAAFCYGYKNAERLDGIDAFILHRHVDRPRDEGGLRLGLRGVEPHRAKKMIYECFRAADTPDWERHFAFALGVVGLPRWE